MADGGRAGIVVEGSSRSKDAPLRSSSSGSSTITSTPTPTTPPKGDPKRARSSSQWTGAHRGYHSHQAAYHGAPLLPPQQLFLNPQSTNTNKNSPPSVPHLAFLTFHNLRLPDPALARARDHQRSDTHVRHRAGRELRNRSCPGRE